MFADIKLPENTLKKCLNSSLIKCSKFFHSIISVHVLQTSWLLQQNTQFLSTPPHLIIIFFLLAVIDEWEWILLASWADQRVKKTCLWNDYYCYYCPLYYPVCVIIFYKHLYFFCSRKLSGVSFRTVCELFRVRKKLLPKFFLSSFSCIYMYVTRAGKSRDSSGV